MTRDDVIAALERAAIGRALESEQGKEDAALLLALVDSLREAQINELGWLLTEPKVKP